LLGVRAVVARSFERIHRANLVALGILPIVVLGDEDPWAMVGPGSDVSLSVAVDAAVVAPMMPLVVHCTIDGQARAWPARLQVTTPSEVAQLRQGTLFDLCLRDVLARIKGAGIGQA